MPEVFFFTSCPIFFCTRLQLMTIFKPASYRRHPRPHLVPILRDLLIDSIYLITVSCFTSRNRLSSCFIQRIWFSFRCPFPDFLPIDYNPWLHHVRRDQERWHFPTLATKPTSVASFHVTLLDFNDSTVSWFLPFSLEGFLSFSIFCDRTFTASLHALLPCPSMSFRLMPPFVS